MATVIVPTRTDLAIYRERVDLEGVTFTLDFQYNSREGAWYFDLLDAEGTTIRPGIKVVVGVPLLRLVQGEARPTGEMLALDQSGEDADPGLEDLGDRVLLAYAEAADVAEALAEG